MKKQSTRPNAPKKKVALSPSAIFCTTVKDFVIHHCSDTAWGKQALGALRARDFKKLLSVSKSVEEHLHVLTADSTDSTAVCRATDFLVASQFVALVSKYQYPEGSIPGVEPERAALDDLLSQEHRNRRLNTIFRAHLTRGTSRHWCIPLMRDVCCRVLGRTPFFERILDKCDFSGGASVVHSGSVTHLAAKLLKGELSGNAKALDYFVCAITRNHQYTGALASRNADGWVCYSHEEISHAIAARHKEIDYNIVSVVPKKADKGRTIGKEPELHNFVQKGIDLEMRELLKRKLGIDLSDQSRNQKLAHLGSLEEAINPYVTIDLRGASNGVFTELVRTCIPPAWFRLLDGTRSQKGMIDGKLHSYQMFCSMGNGFCFPLESLLFAAAVIAAHKHCGEKLDYAVYGDDIIVRQSVALVVIECLLACGFRTNTSKTFVFGPFRESCGANWYGGLDVTPGYYKDQITSRSRLYSLHNALHKWPILQQGLRAHVTDLRHCVPTWRMYSWVTDQAFRLPMDICMTVKGTKWNRQYQNWTFPISISVPQPHVEWSEGLDSSLVDHMIFTAVLRGSTPEEPFHLRFSTKSRTSDTLNTPKQTARPGWALVSSS